MVADLLALQVQPGVLKLGRQPLALLLELLQGPLALITICLQVPELVGEMGVQGQRPSRGLEVLVEEVRRGRCVKEREVWGPRMKSGLSRESKTL